jgi:alkaline phosphatase
MAQVNHRFMEGEIAEQITASGVDVLFGGGRGYFIPASREGSLRKDEKNLLDQFKESMAVATTVDEFEALGDENPAVALLYSMHPAEAKNRKPSLTALVQKALAILSKNKNGFVLLIEGSQIDWAGHDRDANALVEEVVDFDNAIQAAVDFALENEETLIVVTSDHETGGFAIHQGSADERMITETGFTTGSHTATMVPLFAIGPGSGAFGGIHDNTFIGEKLIQYLRNRAE